MDVLQVISSITSLRELKLAENDLQGMLPAAIANLTALEVLDLQSNKLTSLPTEVRLLTSLRTLDISNNHLSRIPSELFETSLVDLRATKNKLGGSLFTIDSIPYLQELHVSNNGLSGLVDGDSISMPALKILNISTNRMASLPNLETWINLHTLLAAENKLATLPEGMFELPLRTLDLTANDLVHLDERLALMPLERLNIAANPLRERKFLTMALDDIKRTLSTRMAPSESAEADESVVGLSIDDTASGQSDWVVSTSGRLDLASKGLSHDLNETDLEPIADQIRQLHLQQNKFESIPATVSIISHLTVLDLSKNNIITALTIPLSIPKLRDLRLTGNKLDSLTPLITHLTAPSLQILDVGNNRLTGSLPVLRQYFPDLISLIACDNSISEVSAESIMGLKIVNLSNNDIERLEPRIGLFVGTLTGLNVEGNKFRVPNYHVLQKGTDAVLAWLRDKIPRESWKSDGTEGEFFDAVDGAMG
jgi:Leucine-rich repeat (LRR) protein